MRQKSKNAYLIFTLFVYLVLIFLLYSKIYGMAGSIPVIFFIICAVLCIGVYFFMNGDDSNPKKEEEEKSCQSS